ncbi:MAG: DUF11 domain-containing protein [Saprospiraceae bacterium]|nr:DUF11 domain-containing protein [Saprospiraceae bacterium]
MFKTLGMNQSPLVEAGDKVTFTIHVSNQGAIDAGNIEITDYVPANMTYVQADNPLWSLISGNPTRTLTGVVLLPGESTSADIILTVNAPLAANTVITNWAEISAATDADGNAQVDIDSNPDANNDDLFLVENDVTGNGKTGGDEDDHDPLL